MNTTFDEQRKAPIILEGPEEVHRGDHRSTPENPITGFSLHPTEVTGQAHVVGDTSYLGEAHKIELRGGAHGWTTATASTRQEARRRGRRLRRSTT